MLIFDFDGVLINSIDEVTVSAYNAATDSLEMSLDALPDALVRLYQENRFHVQPAGDQPLLMGWCVRQYRSFADRYLTREMFEGIVRSSRVPLVDRTSRFYARRREFIEADPQKWLALHNPFQPIWRTLIRRGGRRVVILTNKNRDSLKILCCQHGLDIPDQNIYAGDNGTSKIANLASIHARFACERYDFIDDSLNNLRDLDLAARPMEFDFFPILAAWGYIGPDSKQQALDWGYRVYEQADLIADLDAHLPAMGAEN